MPKKFWLDANDNICRRGTHCSTIVAAPLLHEYSDPREAAGLVDLLNKVAHFERLDDALKASNEWIPDDTPLHAENSVVIAKCTQED